MRRKKGTAGVSSNAQLSKRFPESVPSLQDVLRVLLGVLLHHAQFVPLS